MMVLGDAARTPMSPTALDPALTDGLANAKSRATSAFLATDVALATDRRVFCAPWGGRTQQIRFVLATVVRFEADVDSLLNDDSRTTLKFPLALGGYQRLLAHKVCQYYGLQTRTCESGDDAGKIVATKTSVARPAVSACVPGSNLACAVVLNLQPCHSTWKSLPVCFWQARLSELVLESGSEGISDREAPPPGLGAGSQRARRTSAGGEQLCC